MPLVIEQHNKPGGYATSFTRIADGKTFSCEVSLHAISGYTQTEDLYEQLGVRDKITFVPHEHSWFSVFPDFTLDLPVCDLEYLEEILVEKFPQEESGLSEYMNLWKNLVADMTNYLKWETPLLLLPFLHPTMWRISNKTLANLLDKYIQDQTLKAILSQGCAYSLPPSQVPAAYLLMNLAFYYTYGAFYIQGTSQSLSNALVEVIQDSGGEVILGTKVTEIILKNRRAVGVKTEDGEMYYGNAVVSNASVPQTFGELIPKSKVPILYNKLSSYTVSGGSFNVWLGLNQDITNKIPSSNVIIYPGYNLEESYEAALACDPEKAVLLVLNYDKIIDGFSPEGYSTILLCMGNGFEHWKKYEADYFAGNKDAYYAEKDRITENLINKAEEHLLPGLSQMIVMKEASTPLTNARFTLNPQGAIVGYNYTMDYSAPFRLGSRTPIKRLYLSSAWSNQLGGGYEPLLLGGKDTFKSMIEDWFCLF
jgi:prolycopene isomerase